MFKLVEINNKLAVREIKFRAWDKSDKKLKYSDDYSGLGLFFELKEYREEYGVKYELMQYTGFKDKNDKEIYECDIVRYGERIFQIRIGNIDDLISLKSVHVSAEVIGNVFENEMTIIFHLKKQLINQMLDGEIDIYQIHTSPEGEAQRQLSKEIDALYNEAAQSGYHLDDDAEAIYKSILEKYEFKAN